MEQSQNNVDRFAGRFMIQDNDHMAEIPQTRDANGRPLRQAEQGQQASGQQGQGRKEFVYESPRQVH